MAPMILNFALALIHEGFPILAGVLVVAAALRSVGPIHIKIPLEIKIDNLSSKRDRQ